MGYEIFKIEIQRCRTDIIGIQPTGINTIRDIQGKMYRIRNTHAGASPTNVASLQNLISTLLFQKLSSLELSMFLMLLLLLVFFFFFFYNQLFQSFFLSLVQHCTLTFAFKCNTNLLLVGKHTSAYLKGPKLHGGLDRVCVL